MPELLQEWVTIQAERQPGAAVVGNDERLTYARLEEQSNQLARLLRDAGCKKGDRVCLLMPKSPTAIVSLLGIYKADCLYVPLDPAGPAARLAKIVESCESRWILAAGPVSHVLDELVDDVRFRGSISVGWVGSGPPPGEKLTAAFTLDDVGSYPGTVLDYDNDSSPAFRPVRLRHLRRLRGRGRAASRAAGAERAAAQAGGVHPDRGADAVVLGALRPDVHGEVRRGAGRRLPVLEAPPLVRRGLPDTGARVLDATAAPRDVHESVRTHGGHHREQLPHGRALPGGRAGSGPHRAGVRRRGAARAR
ncbi:MAG: hypothetical protein DMD86_19050 [Candidatus Rokuibacteriota bacterium]|nr:MAG: hypothetical protein DMD86_19050 [Candidatus Rokubacteria bacterium]